MSTLAWTRVFAGVLGRCTVAALLVVVVFQLNYLLVYNRSCHDVLMLTNGKVPATAFLGLLLEVEVLVLLYWAAGPCLKSLHEKEMQKTEEREARKFQG